MTDREKLIRLMVEAKKADTEDAPFSEFLADFLLANGVIVPPCNVGDVVYPLSADRRFRAFVEKIEITATHGMLFEWVQYDVGVDSTETWDDGVFAIGEIGKTVFLSEAEYEKALAERSEKNDR